MDRHGKSAWLAFDFLCLLGRLRAWSMILLLTFFVGFGLYELWAQESAFLFWKETNGRVIASKVRFLTSDTGRTQIGVTVRYRYAVGGSEYVSGGVTTGEPKFFDTYEDAQEFCRRYPVGSAVTVWYAPFRPSVSALLRERGVGPWILLGLGIPALVLVFWFTRRDGRKEFGIDLQIDAADLIPSSF